MSNGSTAAVRWLYKAATADGTSVRGEIEAASERDAIDQLRRRALWVLELSPTTDGKAASSALSGGHVTSVGTSLGGMWRTITGASSGDLAVSIRAVATLLSAGVPLARALEYAVQEAASVAQRDGFARVQNAVLRGEPLSEAVAGNDAFPPIFAPLIAAGEESGTLDRSLELLATHLERRDALREKIRSAMIYPTLLAVASIVGVLVILIVVVPRFAALIADSGGQLPLSTRMLIAVSAFITTGWWLIALLVGVTALGMNRWLRDPRARQQLDGWRLRLPVFGHFERLQAAAGYTGTLAVGLSAGVSLLKSMALARAVVSNQALQAGLADAETRVHGGDSVSAAIGGLLPPLMARLIDAGEVSGDLAGMAARAAESADVQLQRSLTQLVTLIEPVMILGFGGLVGFVALALLQAIYGLNASVL